MSDELERKVSDDEETKDEDVEAHRKHHGSMTDDGATSEDSDDDVEAHRKHHGA
jgi:hypothetical protein